MGVNGQGPLIHSLSLLAQGSPAPPLVAGHLAMGTPVSEIMMLNWSESTSD